MTSSDVVTGGQSPARHHKLVRLLLGAAIGCVSFALVFASGYLFGSNERQLPQATAGEIRPPVGAALPAPDPDVRRAGGGLGHDKPKDKSNPDRGPWKALERFVTVAKGDSLWKIAAAIAPNADRQDTVERIVRLNSLESAGLEIGQRLVVPVEYRTLRKTPDSQKPSSRPRRQDDSQHPGKNSRPAQPGAQRPRQVAPPTYVSVPSIALEEDLVELNVIGGTLQVPTDYADVGWWRDGPSPGAPGSAVLVGHVDSPTGPAVFYQLSSINIGDLVHVRRADGTKATFRVTDATLYPRASFPSTKVYRERGRPILRLITCGGSFNRTLGLYTHNLVVTAVPADAKRR